MIAAAASSLLADLLGSSTGLVEVARTAVSVHYETGRADVPVLCVCVPTAVRLPNAVVTSVLPRSGLRVVPGGLSGDADSWRVGRWWQPPRPMNRTPAQRASLDLDPSALVGRGPGLTPSGDDEVAGALVAAHATGDPRLDAWCSATRDALLSRRTTAVSWGLLHHALEGWATPELAAHVDEACTGHRGPAFERLLTVGHTSGRALAEGVAHVVATRPSMREEA
ncbi:MAG: DUF2877 domain-containing protein [Nocardioidaceae bacterium]